MAEAEAVGADDLTDETLLERFTSRREEAAFAALVRRYGPLVLSVCRRVLQHEQDAEDAFQAVFCVLARRAGSIHRRAAVGAWLHAVAFRIARKARAARGRPPVFETSFPDLPAPEESPTWVWRELRSVLDEEVNRLPAKYRRAFILCYLQGRTNEEAAAQLGCPLGTVLSRLARARERLRVRLTRRGLALSAGALAAALGSQAAGAGVQAALAEATVRAGLHYAAGQPVAAGVAALADGFLKTLAWVRLILVFGLGSALTAILGGGLLFWLVPHGAGTGDTAAPARPAPSPQAEQEKLQGGWQMISSQKGGQPPGRDDIRFVFAGDQLTMFVGGVQMLPIHCRLDPSQEPKAIDFTMPTGKVLRGICELDEETWKLCFDPDPANVGSKRPTTFRPPPDAPNVVLWVFRREPARP